MSQPTQNLVTKIAAELLVSFRSLPGFTDANLGAIHPIYSPDGTNISHYEVEYRSPKDAGVGYAIVSATKDDFPVAEFSHHALSHYHRFRTMARGREFKMVRFGPTYIAAENSRGQLLAEIGDKPFILPKQLKVRARGEGSNRMAPSRRELRPSMDWKRLLKTKKSPTYKQLKMRYRPAAPRKARLRDLWAVAESQHSPWSTRVVYPGRVEYYVEGFANHPYYLQIPKGTGANNTSHASGCGPTAWMNLFGWHDLNWTPKLLEDHQSPHTNSYIYRLTMDVHDYIGTIWMFGQGFTWPEDMVKGYQYAQRRLGFRAKGWYRYDWWNTDEAWVFAVARDAVKNKNRPFIVGYFEDMHYAIGCGIAESKYEYKDPFTQQTRTITSNSIYIYPAWSRSDSGNKWIPMETIFAVYAVDRFDAYLQRMWESQWTLGWTSFVPFVLDGQPHFLAYKSGTGRVAIDRIRANGRGKDTIWDSTWTTGWTHFMPMPFEFGLPHFLAYKSGTGRVAIDRIRADGRGKDTIWESTWATGWTHFMPFVLNGHRHFLAYKSGTGKVAIDRVKPDGRGLDTIWEATWSKGWTTLMPFVLNGQPHLLAYKSGTGKVAIDRIKPDGHGVDTLWESNWSRGWSTFMPYVHNGQPHYLAYKSGTGQMDFDRIKADAKGVVTIAEDIWDGGSIGQLPNYWTAFVPFYLSGRLHFLIYKAMRGTAAIERYWD